MDEPLGHVGSLGWLETLMRTYQGKESSELVGVTDAGYCIATGHKITCNVYLS
jgi:hypothetical protein